jgi:hypothetical protein
MPKRDNLALYQQKRDFAKTSEPSGASSVENSSRASGTRASVRAARVLIGTSGWHYNSWNGPFFPRGLSSKDRLRFYGSQFSTTELNGVFYRTPTEEAVKRWREQTPEGFVFAWKASKFITHWKRLADRSEKQSGASRKPHIADQAPFLTALVTASASNLTLLLPPAPRLAITARAGEKMAWPSARGAAATAAPPRRPQ